MSPVALGLALVLHGLAIVALWKMSPFRPPEPPQDALMITVDAGAPPASPDSPSGEKPADPETASTPEPTPPERAREEPQQAAAEPPPRQAEAQRPEPPAQPQPQPPPPPPPSPAPPPSLEAALASPQELPPPDARDFPTIRMPLPPWPSPRPSPTAETPPPPPPSPPPRPPQPAAAPPPQNAPASVQAPPSNSADWLIGKSRARNAYLDQVARLTSKYRRYPASAFDNKQQGRVVTRVTIARDGKLIDVRIDTSSGWPAIDAAELETIRKSAPFPPVPVDMPGDPLILILPINYDVAFSGRR